MQNDNSSKAYRDHGTEGQNQQNDTVYPSPSTSPSNSSILPLYNPRILMQQHQDMINRHNLCLTRLREATKEANSLRHENAALQSLNRDLNKQLSSIIQASVQSHFASSDYNTTPFEVVDAFRGLCIGGVGGGEEEIPVESPTSVIEEGSGVDVERVMLPKSISVRSNGYLKMTNQGSASHGCRARGSARPARVSPLSGAQKVYVQGGKKEEEPLELEVYNQGMYKTELCNKWQETGACPYGDHCQFAHGIEELRPVIRHPRYKTEVCRMVLAGEVCPYGHRCHFRHALTEQERFRDRMKPRAVRLNR
ncbi:hypothetical protein SLEP1_g54217 [Rubroshorea leprosula]|uniref:C3H1-type domain-containing protein n=1 Tax=Rubroshorea leprosula TaxID=152421 RepID=A0AAV5MBP5_9ROSI|nr:hypothetical protein SLEP1_g54217 [Rubroshorea leprosula]